MSVAAAGAPLVASSARRIFYGGESTSSFATRSRQFCRSVAPRDRLRLQRSCTAARAELLSALNDIVDYSKSKTQMGPGMSIEDSDTKFGAVFNPMAITMLHLYL